MGSGPLIDVREQEGSRPIGVGAGLNCGRILGDDAAAVAASFVSVLTLGRWNQFVKSGDF